VAVEALDRDDDLLCRTVALHARGGKQGAKRNLVLLPHAGHVAPGGARRRGDDADATGQQRQRALARGVEQTLLGEARLELLVGEL